MWERIPVILFTLSLLLGSTLITNVSVLATDGGSSTLELVLNQSKAEADQKIADLQNAGLTVPDAANSTYTHGLEEYQTAMGSVNTDLQGAKIHALKAMDLFTNTIQLTEMQQNSTSGDANQTAALVQSITDSQNNAVQIKALAQANGVSTSIFGDYDTAINAVNTAIANGDFQSATQQLSIAQNLLDNIYQQLQNQAQASVDYRANQFLGNTETTLSQMIENAKSIGLSQSTIDALQSELDKLQAAKTASEIIDTTNESSQLQGTTDQYNNQRLANFDKESSKIQNEINVLQGLADQNNLQLVGLAQLVQTLDDIKQKISNGQTDDAASELEQEDSLLTTMSDVVNGAPSIVQDINAARNVSQTLQGKAQAQSDSDSLNNIGQANQLLDNADSTVLNATSSDDLKSARDTLAQAQNILNNVNDVLNSSNQQSGNQTQNSNQTSSTESNSTNNSSTGSNPPSDNSTSSSNPPNSPPASDSNSTG
jgi:hypothetical protein